MTFLRPSSVLAVALVLCACASMSHGERKNWREVPSVQNFLARNPRAQRMTQGPIGGIIDFIISIILDLLDFILGGSLVQFGKEMRETKAELDEIKAIVGLA